MRQAARTPKAPKGRFVVVLSAAPNPDYDPGSWEAEVALRPEYKTVKSLRAASQATQQYIARHDLGGGNWTGGAVYDDKGARVASISYNGRVWGPGQQAKEIKVGSSHVIIDYFTSSEPPNPRKRWTSNVGENTSTSRTLYFRDMKKALKDATGLPWQLQRNTKDVPAQAIWSVSPAKADLVLAVKKDLQPPSYFNVRLTGMKAFFQKPVGVEVTLGLSGNGGEDVSTFKLDGTKSTPDAFASAVAHHIKALLQRMSTPLDWDSFYSYDMTLHRLPKSSVPAQYRVASAWVRRVVARTLVRGKVPHHTP